MRGPLSAGAAQGLPSLAVRDGRGAVVQRVADPLVWLVAVAVVGVLVAAVTTGFGRRSGDQSVIAGRPVAGSASTTITTPPTTGPTAPLTPAPDLLAAAQAVGLGQFAALVEQAGLTEAMRWPGPLMVFAPTDEAFAALPTAALDALRADRTLLVTVLSYHVVLADGPLEPGVLTTGQGGPVEVRDAGDGSLTVNRAVVRQPVSPAINGTVYPIDRVLIPPGVTLPGVTP